MEEGCLLCCYKCFFVDIESVGGECLIIYCLNIGLMFNCMSEGCWVWFSCFNDFKCKLLGIWELSEIL